MNKALILIAAFLFSLAFIPQAKVKLEEKKLLGKWNWEYFIKEDGSKVTLEELFMGMATITITEFKENGVYTEYKNKMGSDELGSHDGSWRIAGSDTLYSKSKDYKPFKPTIVQAFGGDSMIYNFKGNGKLVLRKIK